MTTSAIADLLGLPQLPIQLAAVETAMRDAVSRATPSLGQPILALINNRGKRLRPILVIAAATAGGAPVAQSATRAAAAIELAHLATLVHDDIMDQATIRWGQPTLSRQLGTNQAIVIGDYLLALSVAEAAAVSQEIGRELATAIATVCDGQSRETADDYNVARSIEDYNRAIHDKTAALFAAACKIGALAGALPAHQVKAMEKYGEAFGMAFQLIDDVLDLTATTEALGKPVDNDAKTGVYTLPLLLALQGSQAPAIRPMLGPIPTQPLSSKKLRKLVKESGAIDQTLSQANEHIQTATISLQSLPKTLVVSGLQKLPTHYLEKAVSPMLAIL